MLGVCFVLVFLGGEALSLVLDWIQLGRHLGVVVVVCCKEVCFFVCVCFGKL